MLCLNPINTTVGMVPCRQCQNCRINLQRTWACRIQLESLWYASSSFVTLTYDPEYLPSTLDGLPTLSPRDLMLFLKRFRNLSGSFRYFACGEYGTQTERPHYHLVIFGISPMSENQISTAWSDPETKTPMGYTSIYDLNEARSAYVAQYTTKKMTSLTSRNLNGRWPEFSRMSRGRKPGDGIGGPIVPWLADQHMTRLGASALADQGDVFTSIRLNGKIWPLGQYLRKHLRIRLGVPAKALDRASMFDKVYSPDPGEWACPLEDYCPYSDVSEINTVQNNVRQEKIKKLEIPELRKAAAHRARKGTRRNSQTIHV